MRSDAELEAAVRDLYRDDARAGAALVYLTQAFIHDWFHSDELVEPTGDETQQELTERIIREVDARRPADSEYTFETAMREAEAWWGERQPA